MNEDKIKELKNMHTKGELAKMYLDIRKELIEEFEEFIDKNYKLDPQGLYYKLKRWLEEKK